MAEHEYESSVRIPLKRRHYDQIIETIVPSENYVIMYFPKNIRMSKNRMQCKKVQKETKILFCREFENRILMFPLTRRHAIEYSASVPQDISEVETFVYRSIIFDEETPDSYHLRMACECVVTKYEGAHYQFTAEIEYLPSAFHYFSIIKMLEEILISSVLHKVGAFVEDIKSEDIFGFDNPVMIVHVCSRKFSMFNETYSHGSRNNEVCLFKYDGFKGRLYYHNGQTFYYDDLHNFLVCENSFFSFAENVVFQIELLAEQKYLVVTDIIGAYCGGIDNENLYMPEPLDVLVLFDAIVRLHIPNKKPPTIILGDLGTYTLMFQKPLSSSYSETSLPYDGHLVIRNNIIFKLKLPTLDARSVNGYLHIDAMAESLNEQYFDFLENGYIYEICSIRTAAHQPLEQMTFTVLRLRFDRPFSSTREEYEHFLKELIYMRKHLKPLAK